MRGPAFVVREVTRPLPPSASRFTVAAVVVRPLTSTVPSSIDSAGSVFDALRISFPAPDFASSAPAAPEMTALTVSTAAALGSDQKLAPGTCTLPLIVLAPAPVRLRPCVSVSVPVPVAMVPLSPVRAVMVSEKLFKFTEAVAASTPTEAVSAI